MTSRILKQLERDVVVAKPYKNQFVLVEPIRLLMLWSCRRKLPLRPREYRTVRQRPGRHPLEHEGCCCDLFRAAWLRTQYMKTTSYELYVATDRMSIESSIDGRVSRSPERVSIFPAEDRSVFLGSEKVNGLPAVSTPQNFVDLMSIGGSGPRVALQLGTATGLLEV